MNTIKVAIKDWKILKRIIITILLVFLFRWGTLITLPGVDFSGQINDSSFLGIMNMLGGGGISNFSIFALGVSPYITSSVIVQLLSSDVIPYFSRLRKQGEKGSIKMEKITRIICIFFAILQGFAIIATLQSAGMLTSSSGGTLSVTLTIELLLIMLSGTMISLWIADQITISGIGNGTSLIIFIGIAARIPSTLTSEFVFFIYGSTMGDQVLIGIITFIFYLLFTFLLIWLISFFETSQRRLPIQQTGQGLNLENNKQNYLPLKINPAGVIPIIFASSIITLPPTIAQIFSNSAASYWIIQHFALTNWFGLTLYALLLILFTFFYAHININSEQISEDFQKSSTFILGVKPGEQTRRYISKVVTLLSIMGAAFLTILSILPYLLTFLGIPKSIAVGGTSMIILISVAIDTWEQLKARTIAASTTVKKKEQIINKNSNSKKSETILFD